MNRRENWKGRKEKEEMGFKEVSSEVGIKRENEDGGVNEGQRAVFQGPGGGGGNRGFGMQVCSVPIDTAVIWDTCPTRLSG